MTSSPPAGRPLLGTTPGGCFIEGGRPHRWTESLSRRSGGLVFGPRGARLSLRLSEQNAFWHGFWTNNLRFLRSRGTYVYRGRISVGGQEKGVDVSIAVDLVALAYDRAYEVAVTVSQDCDLGPAVGLAKKIAKAQGRSLIFESAFPHEEGRGSPRGIPGCTWIHIDRSLYDACRDPTDYRPL